MKQRTRIYYSEALMWERYPVCLRTKGDVFAVIEANRQAWPVAMMCRLLGVTRAGFYAWRAREPSQRQLDDQSITAQIRSVHVSSLSTYGSPRVSEAMRQAGVS